MALEKGRTHVMETPKMNEHHFQCRSCKEWRVIEAVGNVISTVLCPRCRKPMKPVRLIQTRLPLK